MPILKHHKSVGFVQIPNILAQSPRLSYEALGVLVNLLSRPEDWVIRKSFLQNQYCGETRLNRIFKELRESGYLKVIDERENGRIVDRVWIVSDEPMSSSENDIKILENLNCGKPQAEETSSWVNHELQINTNTNIETEKTNILGDCVNNEQIEEKKSRVSQKELEIEEAFKKCLSNDYPVRDEPAPEHAALKQFKARILRDKVPMATLVQATKNYRHLCESKGIVGTEWVMKATKFYGRERHYEAYVEIKKVETWQERVLAKRQAEREQQKNVVNNDM